VVRWRMLRAVRFACLVAVTSGLSCNTPARAENNVTDRSGLRGSTVSALAKQEIAFQSGELTLHGVVYMPSGSGPFPAVLWNHGSWGDPMVAFDHLAPTFTDQGWVFFGPFRRGQGLSRSAGPYILDEIERAGRNGGPSAKAAKAVSLLTREHLEDQLAAYAWLKGQSYVFSRRIAVAGNSFGGIEVVLGAERVPYCAAVNGAGGSMSWAQAAELRDVMMRAARVSRSPMFLFQAENDFDLSPSRTLGRVMSAGGKAAEVKIYPPYGKTQGEGHNFAWLGSDVWGPDVLAFLRHHCGG
jgi:carboxymethylenebutenolidase